MKNGPGEDDFELSRGLPVTVDDEVVRRHYQEKHDAGNSNYDGDEMIHEKVSFQCRYRKVD